MGKIDGLNDLEKLVASRSLQKRVRLDFDDKPASGDSVNISDEAKKRLVGSKVIENISKDVEPKK